MKTSRLPLSPVPDRSATPRLAPMSLPGGWTSAAAIGFLFFHASVDAQDATIKLTRDYFTDPEGSITTGVYAFLPGVSPFPALHVNSAAGVSGGVVEFFQGSRLHALNTGGVTGGSQNFYDNSLLHALSQQVIIGGTQSFFQASQLQVESDTAITGGTQRFFDSSALVADVPIGATLLSSGTQNFYDTSRLQANVAKVISAEQINNSIQNFLGQSRLIANAAFAIDGGQQNFHNQSAFQADVAMGLSGGTQTFGGSSILAANAAGAITGGMQIFTEGSQFYAGIRDAIAGGDQIFRDRSAFVAADAAATPALLTFEDSSSLRSLAARGVSGGTQEFSGATARLEALVAEAVTGGTQNFSGYYSGLNARGSEAITGGEQNFTGTLSRLEASGTNAVVGGVQNFYGASSLAVFASRGVSGGEQIFYHGSTLINLANWENSHAIAGGIQRFYSNSSLVAAPGGLGATGGGVTGGTQYFYDNSYLEAGARRSVSGVTIHLAHESKIEVFAPEALDRTTHLFFDGTAHGSTGGRVNLYGNDLTIGRLSSINGGGLITNDVAGQVANLTVDFDTGTATFAGRIEDGGPWPVNFTKRGAGTQIFTSAQGYTGGTAIEGGTLRLDFSAANAPLENIIHPGAAQLTLAGTRLELVGKSGADNRQGFSSLALAGASRFALNPNGANIVEVHLGDYSNLQQEEIYVGRENFRDVTRPISTADFSAPAGSAIKFSGVAGSPALPWATMNNGAAFAQLTPVGATGDHGLTPLTAYDTSINGVDFHTAGALLRFDDPVNSYASGAAKGILVTSAVGANESRYLLTDIPPLSPVFLHQYNTAGELVFLYSLVRGDNGQTPLNLIKTGPGTLRIDGSYRVNSGAAGGIVDGPVNLRIQEGSVITDGTIVGDVLVGSRKDDALRAILGGNLTIGGKLIVGQGGGVSPGRSPGIMNSNTQEWEGGGFYKWEINDTLGMAGAEAAGWDLMTVVGLLEITATPDVPFVLDLHSLSLANVAGTPANFNPLMDYAWTIAVADGGVSGFDEDAFELVHTNFTAMATGTFGVGLDGNEIRLLYSAIPEPSSLALAAAFALCICLRKRR